MHFSPERRERFLTLLETGRNVTEAASAVGISRGSVNKWVRAGQAPNAPADKAEFSRRYEEIRKGPQTNETLTQADLIRLLEVAARKGSVQALKMLLDRPWEQAKPIDDKPVAPVLSLMDRLAERREASS